MRKFELSLFVACLINAATFSCAEDKTAPFTVGAILPLTGVTSDYGQSIEQSIKLAIEDSPKNFEQVRFIYEDVAYDTKLAVTAFQKLTSVAKVDVVYVWGIAACKAVAPLAQARGVPMVGQCVDPETTRGRPGVLRFMNYTDQYLRTLAKFLDARGIKHLSVVLTDNAYLEEMYAALERNLAPGQTVSILQRFPPGEMDFRSVLSRIGNSKPDAVGVFVSVGQVASFYRQRRQLEMDIPTFGTNLFESVSEIEASGSSMDGALFANNEIHPDYISRFKQKFGHASQLAFGAPAYEFARALGTIIATASDRLSGAEFLNALENLPEQKGLAAGPYVFRNTPEAGKFFDFPLVVKEIRGREFVVVGKNLGQ